MNFLWLKIPEIWIWIWKLKYAYTNYLLFDLELGTFKNFNTWQIKIQRDSVGVQFTSLKFQVHKWINNKQEGEERRYKV